MWRKREGCFPFAVAEAEKAFHHSIEVNKDGEPGHDDDDERDGREAFLLQL